MDFSLFTNIPDKSTDAAIYQSLRREMIIRDVDMPFFPMQLTINYILYNQHI